MRKLTHLFAVKVTAVFLFVIAVIVLIGGAIGTYFLLEYHFFQTFGQEAREELYESITRRNADSVFYDYFLANQNNSFELKEQQEDFSAERTNFLFILKNAEGDPVFSNYSNQEYQFSRSYPYEENRLLYEEAFDNNVHAEHDRYTMDCFVRKTLTANDSYATADYWVRLLYDLRNTVIAAVIISFISAIILFLILMCSAGHRRDEEKVIPNGIDKIPFDIFIAGYVFIAFMENAILQNTGIDGSIPGIVITLTVFLVLDTLLLLLFCMTLATRYKLGGWWRNTVIYRVLHFCFKIVRKLYRGLKYFFQNSSLVWKMVLGMLGVCLAEFLVIGFSYRRGGTIMFLWMVEKAILAPTALMIVISLGKLKNGGQKIADGDLSYHIDTRHMFRDFKQHGENLNSIRSGMSKAVDERMKSERFKTELITNVSHDIKTPLTSIINYADLMGKEEIENPALKEYVDVIVRQSSRLKKLIEDLVEASKASTGNMTVNKTRTQAGVLLTQAVGEYEEKIKGSRLELVLEKPEEPVFIMADGRLLWRVFDNLMSNICKYAQPATRVYLNLENREGQAVITLKNTSKYALNITADELMERFVRGDSARHTEGSGLGLSIAKSLVELQNGFFELQIDGDLFKVVIRMNTVLQEGPWPTAIGAG